MCDEHDHKDRDVNYEIRQQKFIDNQLNCKFIGYNPDIGDGAGVNPRSLASKILRCL